MKEKVNFNKTNFLLKESVTEKNSFAKILWCQCKTLVFRDFFCFLLLRHQWYKDYGRSISTRSMFLGGGEANKPPFLKDAVSSQGREDFVYSCFLVIRIITGGKEHVLAKLLMGWPTRGGGFRREAAIQGYKRKKRSREHCLTGATVFQSRII